MNEKDTVLEKCDEYCLKLFNKKLSCEGIETCWLWKTNNLLSNIIIRFFHDGSLLPTMSWLFLGLYLYWPRRNRHFPLTIDRVEWLFCVWWVTVLILGRVLHFLVGFCGVLCRHQWFVQVSSIYTSFVSIVCLRILRKWDDHRSQDGWCLRLYRQ